MQLEIYRNGDTNTTCRVDYFTRDGNAKAGVHYIVTNGTAVFGPGESVKEITVTLTADDGLIGGDLTFHLYLTNAVNASLEVGWAQTDSLTRRSVAQPIPIP